MKPTLLFMLLFTGIQSFAYSKDDTTTILYDYSWNVIESGYPAFVSKVWKEGDNWHKQDFYYPEATLKMDGIYRDKALKVRNGLFTWYHKHGIMSDSCVYIDAKRSGRQITWDIEGNQLSFQNWHENLPVDTAIWWNSDGSLTAVQITDSAGNGFYQQYLADEKTLRVKGLLLGGKRVGKWFFKDKDGILGAEAIYINDSVISAVCYNEKGEVDENQKGCTVEKPAGFKGGSDGWRRYLERSLKYPEDAYSQRIQGTVRVEFTIEKDGSVSDIKILSAPNESLGQEGLRIVKQSPKWEPAIQYNRKVIYRHIQSITFALQ